MTDMVRTGFRPSRIAIYGVLLLACLVYLIPLIVMLITSFKTPMDIRSGNLLALPTDWTTIGWTKAWSEACTGVQCEGVKGYFWNSFKMTVPAVMISTLLGAFNGYVLSKWKFKGSDLLFGIFMVSLIWQFTQIWNDFLFGVVFASGDSQPITVALNNLVNTSTGVKEYNVDMAAAMIAALPTLVVYIVAGKYFIRGLTAGSVKG